MKSFKHFVVEISDKKFNKIMDQEERAAAELKDKYSGFVKRYKRLFPDQFEITPASRLLKLARKEEKEDRKEAKRQKRRIGPRQTLWHTNGTIDPNTDPKDSAVVKILRDNAIKTSAVEDSFFSYIEKRNSKGYTHFLSTARSLKSLFISNMFEFLKRDVLKVFKLTLNKREIPGNIMSVFALRTGEFLDNYTSKENFFSMFDGDKSKDARLEKEERILTDDESIPLNPLFKAVYLITFNKDAKFVHDMIEEIKNTGTNLPVFVVEQKLTDKFPNMANRQRVL